MQRARSWREEREGLDHHGELWWALAERVCSIDSRAPDGPHRIAHQDLPGMDTGDLVLELRRAIFRSCLQRGLYETRWLADRTGRIVEELRLRGVGEDGQAIKTAPQAPGPRRQEDGNPPRTGISPEAAVIIANHERTIDRAHHDAWLLWQTVQHLRESIEKAKTAAVLEVLPRGIDDGPDPWDSPPAEVVAVAS